MKTGTIHKIFGARLTGQVELTLADWYIGTKRARDLADYALDLFDTGVSSIPPTVSSELKHKIDIARTMVESTVLSWEDESLGPKTEEGIPFSVDGKGAKAEYREYIKNWIEEMTKELGRLAVGAQLISKPLIEPAPTIEPMPKVVPKIAPKLTPAPEIIPPVERRVPPKPETDVEFLRRAEKITKEYPMVIKALRNAFVRQAVRYMPEWGVEGALNYLRDQLEVIKNARR